MGRGEGQMEERENGRQGGKEERKGRKRKNEH